MDYKVHQELKRELTKALLWTLFKILVVVGMVGFRVWWHVYSVGQR